MNDRPKDFASLGLHPVLSRPAIRPYLADVWSRREFILTVPRNNLRAQNMDTLLGNSWYLLNPALQTAVYFLVFGLLFDANRGIDDYLAYLVVGVLTFNLISQATTNAARCVVNNRSLIRSLHFPRAAIPITSAIASFYVYLPGVAIMTVVSLAMGNYPTMRWLLAPVVFGLTAAWILGMVFIVARLGRMWPDVHSLLPHLVRLLFYLSGTLFDPARLTENDLVLRLFDLNPFYELLTIWRWMLLGRHVPGWMWGSITAWSFGTLILGFLFFWQAETSYGSER
jgi:teichoic acid transport system permease protein